jgi:hypothetical protein
MQGGIELRGSVEQDGGMTAVSQLHPDIHHGRTLVPTGESSGSGCGYLSRRDRRDDSGLLWIPGYAVSFSEEDRRLPEAGRVDRVGGRGSDTDGDYCLILVGKRGDGLPWG